MIITGLKREISALSVGLGVYFGRLRADCLLVSIPLHY